MCFLLKARLWLLLILHLPISGTLFTGILFFSGVLIFSDTFGKDSCLADNVEGDVSDNAGEILNSHFQVWDFMEGLAVSNVLKVVF